jgi:2-amino-4-hydroxy-6-hydroxymethyldihydropteridine diphosphokinase
MSAAVLSLGSNLGDRRQALLDAVDGLAPWLVAVSPVFETDPWGPIDQEDYLNIVVSVDDPAAGARSWLARAHDLEGAAGRTRDIRWGPRTLDVDVIAVWDGEQPVLSADEALTLPHPRAAERAFVLVPWARIHPAAQLPGHGSVRDLLAALPESERAGVRLRADLALRVDR